MQSSSAHEFLPTIRKSLEESGHAPFVDVGEVQWSAGEVVQTVISAKEADGPAIVVNRCNYAQNPAEALCGLGKPTAKVMRWHDVR
jgi:hypothetical protein